MKKQSEVLLALDELMDSRPDEPWDGEVLRAARERCGLSRFTLAQVLGVNVTTLSDWETNKTHRPKPEAHEILDEVIARLNDWADKKGWDR